MSDDVKQIVAAYVLGCLDKKNLSQFVDYIHHGGKETEGELGELQNIISLIPVLLSFENPSENIKETIAQKILEKELLTREISHSSRPTNAPEAAGELVDESIQKLEKKPLHEKIEQTKSETDKPVRKKKSFIPIIIVSLFIGLAFISGYLYKINIDANNKIKKLNERILQLKQEISVANDFLSENSALIEFFNSKDITVYNFENIDTSLTADGKLFLSFSNGQGILRINISGKIFSDESLAIWAVMKKNNLQLAEIVYDPLIKYYKIDKIPSIDKTNIKIISITIQKRRSGENVESRILMMGRAN